MYLLVIGMLDYLNNIITQASSYVTSSTDNTTTVYINRSLVKFKKTFNNSHQHLQSDRPLRSFCLGTIAPTEGAFQMNAAIIFPHDRLLG